MTVHQPSYLSGGNYIARVECGRFVVGSAIARAVAHARQSVPGRYLYDSNGAPVWQGSPYLATVYVDVTRA